MQNYRRWMELILPLAVIGSLFVIFVPLPPRVMDFLLAANIAVAMILLLSTIFVKSPLELSVFPSILLGTTLARLALNVGTTRLILTNGVAEGHLAAGGVIQSFGEYVGGNNIAVGLVIFAIIIVIQFVVITKGATRISEVAARFSLDGMPGQQMAIDADLNAGIIDTETAFQRRQQIIANADFYGAMDGASKFVRGDAIAGILITVINIAGGLVIGLSNQMSLAKSAEVFTRLTIGDGLASQLPALLISVAAALLVTRSTRKSDLPTESLTQIFAHPVVLMLTALFLGSLMLVDMPKAPLLLIAGCCFGIAYVLTRSNSKANQSTAAESTPAAPPQPKHTEVTIEKLLNHDILEMELGVNLIPLADPNSGGTLLATITQVRKELAAELGIILPKIRVRDNLKLGPYEYRIMVQGNPADRSTLEPDCLLAVDTGHASAPIEPESVRGIFTENLHSEPAYWIDFAAHEEVNDLGYVVLTATDVLGGQLKDLAAHYAPQLLTRDATLQLIEETKKSSPAVVNELIPDLLSLGEVQQVLKALVSEGVSIRPLGLILETLGDNAMADRNHWTLTEKVRQKLGKHITTHLAPGAHQPLFVFTFSEDLEHRVACAWERDEDEIRLNLPRNIVQGIASAIQDASRKMLAGGHRPVALVDQSIRPVISKIARECAADMFVLGSREALDTPLQIVGEINSEQLVSTVAA